MKIFSAAEIIDMGIEKEKKRRDFYAAVSERFSEKEMKELFTRLRDWEEAHIKKFSEVRGKVAEKEPVESYPGELAGYIHALVDDRLYAEVSAESFGGNVKSPMDAVRYGIGFEKDAVLFFRELCSYLKSGRNRDMVEELITEEKQHIVYLADLMRKLQAK